ncbi:hypothetical protein IC006_0489 [Sulfuracidifex tepidarius]|uniref:Uncharacterized protein n=1 Tax=Sulfuracidifex tepidarius TaxID=1294262 RepID=A0A510DSV1_9CREN|nr:hypothetical protein IC006_0489 [Sulfuracidifex tepidarius]
MQSLTEVRKDVARRLVLGAVAGGNSTEIAQEVGMDYETVLNGLDKASGVSLIEVVKRLVENHPVLLIVDDTHNHKLYPDHARLEERYTGVLLQGSQEVRTSDSTPRGRDEGPYQRRAVLVDVTPYVTRKVEEELRRRGEEVEFKTKIDAFLELLPSLADFNVKATVFDSWYVNSRTLLANTVGELKSNARITECDRLVPVGEFPQGEYLVEYLGTPIKLLVIDDYVTITNFLSYK